MFIHEVDEAFAHVQINGVDYELVIVDEQERQGSDDYRTQVFYDEHTPVITEVFRIDMDYGDYFDVDEDTKNAVIDEALDSLEFIEAYQDLFDANVRYGKSVARCY